MRRTTLARCVLRSTALLLSPTSRHVLVDLTACVAERTPVRRRWKRTRAPLTSRPRCKLLVGNAAASLDAAALRADGRSLSALRPLGGDAGEPPLRPVRVAFSRPAAPPVTHVRFIAILYSTSCINTRTLIARTCQLSLPPLTEYCTSNTV